jgi:hypothetical protein
MDDARSHLRGFARTIPMFLMAYGKRDMRLSNFDDYTPDDVFEEITGITEEEFRTLRDGQDVTEDDGTVTKSRVCSTRRSSTSPSRSSSTRRSPWPTTSTTR